jgi:serine/threonine protein kinase
MNRDLLSSAGVTVTGDQLYLRGEAIDGFEIVKELGRGANGVVFLAKNLTLERLEAVKVWVALRDGDPRDKARQGLMEAIKLAAAHPDHAVQIYSAQVRAGFVVAQMEYIDGVTLKAFCKKAADHDVVGAGYRYLEAIEQTTTPSTCHGDPHWNNALVFEDLRHTPLPVRKVKLCDFGTSVYGNREKSWDRHWAVVRETVVNITKRVRGADEHLDHLRKLEAQSDETVKSAMESPHLYRPIEIARLHTAPFHDYLRSFRD